MTYNITPDKALKEGMKNANLTSTDLKPALASSDQPGFTRYDAGGTMNAPNAAGNIRIDHGQMSSYLWLHGVGMFPQGTCSHKEMKINSFLMLTFQCIHLFTLHLCM